MEVPDLSHDAHVDGCTDVAVAGGDTTPPSASWAMTDETRPTMRKSVVNIIVESSKGMRWGNLSVEVAFKSETGFGRVTRQSARMQTALRSTSCRLHMGTCMETGSRPTTSKKPTLSGADAIG